MSHFVASPSMKTLTIRSQPNTPWAWGIESPFVSLSGDPGQQSEQLYSVMLSSRLTTPPVTVKFVTNNATTPGFVPGSANDFVSFITLF